MGWPTYSSAAYDSLRKTYSTKSTDDIFVNNKTRSIDPEMNPKGLRVRESRDSANHPTSLAIQFWLDETGSMGQIPEKLIREKLGALIETMLKHNIQSPAVLFGGIGDHHCDRHPCQVGQFESGTIELNKWLTGLYLEGSGGGQNKESYLLAWYVASRHTSIDCFEKRGKKGYLFTVGDEKTWDKLDASTLKEIFGVSQAEDITAEQLLKEAQRMYHVFHIHINSTQYRNDMDVIGDWKRLLGQNLIILDDADVVAETVASTIAVMEGVDKDTVLKSIGSSSAVTNALININNTTDLTNSSVIDF